MNKYMGFYELKGINMPTVPWRQFEAGTKLEPGLLWTVRTAVESGGDMSLPRAVGVTAAEAEEKGGQFLELYDGKGLVIYYPYFIAEKSGVLDIAGEKTVIEAVERDLWNLVTDGRRDVTVIVRKDSPVMQNPSLIKETPRIKETSLIKDPPADCGTCGISFAGNSSFLDKSELSELLKYASVIRGRFRGEISEGRSVIAEWSYAYNTDINHEPVGDRYLVFYELRSV